MYRREIVVAGIEDSLRIVLVCKAEDGRKCFGVIDEGIWDWVDNLKEHPECLREVIDIDHRGS